MLQVTHQGAAPVANAAKVHFDLSIPEPIQLFKLVSVQSGITQVNSHCIIISISINQFIY